MKKLLLFLLPFLFLSCATTSNKVAQTQKVEYPWSTYNVKAGEEIKIPVDCGFIFYGTTKFTFDNWDYSLPEDLGNKTLVASIPYTYYFWGEKHEVFYELVFCDVNLKPEIANQPIFSEIKQGTVIGTASKDNPGLMIRTVNGADPNLVLDSKNPPAEIGNYTYFDASTFMPTTPKFLTFQPVIKNSDLIEFWDYPETLKELADGSIEKEAGKNTVSRFPIFQIMAKTQLSQYPEPIHTASSTDIILRNQFYSFCTTELVTDFDGVPFHLMFYKGFDDYLREEYTLGDDIYLYLTSLFGKNGQIYFYVRDYTLKSPETIHSEQLKKIQEIRKE